MDSCKTSLSAVALFLISLQHYYLQTSCTPSHVYKLLVPVPELTSTMYQHSFSSQNKSQVQGSSSDNLCYTQEVLFSERYYLFKFFCRFLSVPAVPVSTSSTSPVSTSSTSQYQSVPVSVTGPSERPEQLQFSRQM
jgi:hypothetical protein